MKWTGKVKVAFGNLKKFWNPQGKDALKRLKNHRLIYGLLVVLVVTIFIHIVLNVDPNAPLFTWGYYGSLNGEFSSPEGITINATGQVFVVDTGNNRVQVFDQDGTFIRVWGNTGSGDGQFLSPHGIALDNQSNVYIADTGNNRIQVFNMVGQFLRKWGSFGTGVTQFNTPWGISLDTGGHVYVTDTNNNRVMAFDQTGTFWRLWQNDIDELYYPRGIMVNSTETIYVTHNSPNCFIAEMNIQTGGGGYWGNEREFKEPYGITSASNGALFIADTGNNRVVVYSAPPEGWRMYPPNLQNIWRGFLGPRGIAINNATGQLYITDTGNNRVVVANPLIPFIPQDLFPLILSIIFIIAITIVISVPPPRKPLNLKEDSISKMSEIARPSNP